MQQINIGKYIISENTIEKMVELLEKTKIENIEYGGVVYARISDNNLILRNICSGNDHCIKIIELPEYGYGDIVGDYHVHTDNELPSFLDFEDPIDQLKFIGGATTNKIKCYILRREDIGFLNGIARLEKIFNDFAKRCNKENRDALFKEFRNIHDPSMMKLIEEYFDVVEIK